MMKMHLHIIILIYLIYWQVPVVSGQSAPVNEENERMILAYTFYIKQKMSLEFIAGNFPVLHEYVENTTTEWNREFFPAILNIDSALTSRLKDIWAKDKNMMYEKFIRADYHGLTEQDSKQFIDEVNDRSYGHIQSPILETFLIHNPKYQQFPEKEFTDGYISSFSNSDKGNSSLLHLKVLYPRSWLVFDGKRKSVVIEKFVSGYGLGKVSLSIGIEKSKNNFSNERITQLLLKESMQKGLPVGNGVLDYHSDILIDNCKAASIAYDQEKSGSDLKNNSTVSELFVTYYKNYKISMNYTVLLNDHAEAVEKLNQYHKLWKRMADNLVILTQWGQ